MGVGRSPGRTPVKHFLLDSLLGKVNGSLSTGKTVATGPLFCVDLCAGDARQSESGTSSPLIFQKHCGHPIGRKNKATLTLIERDRASFDLLRLHVEKNDWTTLIHGDATKFALPSSLTRKQAVFLHCDPNSVHQTPLTEALVESFTDCTMYLATLGCNVGGIKRLPTDQKEGWRNYVDMLTKRLPSSHDAILFWLMNDSSQWAYLCNVPIVWRDIVVKLATNKQVNEAWEKGVGGVSLKRDRGRFAEQLNRLFLTQQEMNGQMRLF